jgi:regulator of cell morphogenesis and NO signaling
MTGDATMPLPETNDDLRALPTPALVSALAQQHQPVRETLPGVRGLAAKVARVHGAHDARLLGLREQVETLAEAVLAHFEEEERAIFPALAAATPNPAGARRFIEDLTHEHEDLARLLARVRETTGDYAVPSWACTSYRTLFAELRRLEGTLLSILHLEHNVLRPRLEGALS